MLFYFHPSYYSFFLLILYICRKRTLESCTKGIFQITSAEIYFLLDEVEEGGGFLSERAIQHKSKKRREIRVYRCVCVPYTDVL